MWFLGIGLVKTKDVDSPNPSILWEKVHLDTKLKLQRFEFPSGIIFEGKKFGTTKIAIIFNAKSVFLHADSTSVEIIGHTSNQNSRS